MKMKKTDIGVVAFMYLICAAFYIGNTKLNKDSQTYPLFCITLLFGLTTIYLIQMVINARKYGVESGASEIFEGFIPKQFFVSFAIVIAFLALIYVTGFYIAATIFMLGLLLFLKVSLKNSIIVVCSMDLLIFLVFTLFLKVKLPLGMLFS